MRPFGIFHSHEERFLISFCPVHNRLAAERVYGATFIQRKIDERRSVKSQGGIPEKVVDSQKLGEGAGRRIGRLGGQHRVA
ncbi:MAG: hypothetical protein BMS9Abin37_2820 [Acidobacteriota bacterium]|nr:MAG: hypothetical protein BMS9Abin37_2820 [Acidobacteriota bacterium]